MSNAAWDDGASAVVLDDRQGETYLRRDREDDDEVVGGGNVFVDNDDSDGDEDNEFEREAALRDQLRREYAELAAQVEELRKNHALQDLHRQSLLLAQTTASRGVQATNEADDHDQNDDPGDGEKGQTEDTERKSAQSDPLVPCRLAWRVTRVVVLLAWFFLVSFVHVLVFPVSYVRNSMVNMTSNKNPRENERLSVMQAFFSPKGHVGILPRPRVLMTLVLGLVFATFICIITEDEFLFGPKDTAASVLAAGHEDNIVLPIEISFDRVGCKVAQHSYPILHNITGHIPPGQITGVLGPSGAGKSTFAYQLLGRGERLCEPSLGHVYLNGERQALNVILDRVGHVPQKDALLEELTVEETLLHSAAWRLPWYYTEAQRREALEETLTLLDLHHIRHSPIGGLTSRGLSGGERKRVSIGIELITNPSVLIMDEPTSGLDGAAAFKLARRLRRIADQKGVSIIVVLHVPSTRVFDLLDNLVLLQLGEAAYVGPRTKVADAFSLMGFDISGTVTQSRITTPEYLLDVLAGTVPYPSHICPYEDMVSDRYKDSTDNETHCGSRPTLPELWRSIVDGGDTAFYGRSSPGIEGRDHSECEQYPLVRQRICKREFILQNYPRVPKPGLVRQAYLWTEVLAMVAIRQGFVIEAICTIVTAVVCAWVRSYSSSWDARAMAAFFVSVAVSALAAFSAVFQDNVAPIKRAAQAGMVLGAHHNAVVALNLVKAFFTANLFALTFHIALLIRTSDYRILRARRHCEMAYIIFIFYIASWSVSALLCVLGGHHFQRSACLAIGYLLWTHVFAMYSPNKRQINLDSLMLERYPAARIIHIQCSMSPARYFIESFTVWDSVPVHDTPESQSGRRFMLSYFSYRDENLSGCVSALFTFFLTLCIIRWWVFGYLNSTDFHKLFDQPLFAKFSLKLQASLSLSLAVLLTLFVEVKRYRRHAAAIAAAAAAAADAEKSKTE
ncbi:ABC transporter G family member 24 [Hondaea fermentalgiana]|uniref:ABC transporter G family member 24 n=1 Tax=Hondaea fermentalgiana TaxID=2315210 RepID=A0A2R5G6H0_9STRA|nr:ABC transporter G family member 24 [Hondaea fermentalgiana]|eukprot:GBG25919.1 ABC transporter G family member 24 [Hondaea fermentalgiana]